MLLWKENKEKLIRERNIEKLLDAAKLIREEAEVHPPRAELRRRQKEKEIKSASSSCFPTIASAIFSSQSKFMFFITSPFIPL